MDSSIIYQKYLEKAIRFLSFRPRSEKEVRDNLLKNKASVEIVERIINWLTEQRLLNDEEFTKWWIEQRARFRPKGIRVVKFELQEKGISKDTIEKVLHSDTLEIETELEQVKKIVGKKISKYKDFEKFEIYQKLGAYLARKGFGWDTIKEAIDSYIKPE